MNAAPLALEPMTREFLARSFAPGNKPLSEMQVDEARAFMQAGQQTRFNHPLLSTEVVQLAGVPVRIVRSAEPAQGVVLYLHGGGWVLGSPNTHAGIVQQIALRTGATVLVPDYALAPERPFPTALDQCYAIALAACGGSSGIDIGGSKLVLAGDSAGGNLAAAVALLGAQRNELKILLQVLVCPAFEPETTMQSNVDFADGFGLTSESMRWFWNQYAPDRRQWSDWRLCPLRAPRQLLSKAAPALILTAGCDVLRDEGELYAQQLWESGNSATLVRFPGTIHNFPVIDELRDSGPARAALALIASAINSALGNTQEVAGFAAGRINKE